MSLEYFMMTIVTAAAGAIVSKVTNQITNQVADQIIQKANNVYDQYINRSGILKENEEFIIINKEDIPEEAITFVQNNFILNNINVINIIGGDTSMSFSPCNFGTNSEYIMEDATLIN